MLQTWDMLVFVARLRKKKLFYGELWRKVHIRVSGGYICDLLVLFRRGENKQTAEEIHWFPSLKGHCRTIWQLYEKLEGVFASTEFQN